MNEKIIAKSECSKNMLIAFRLFPIILGVVLMASCYFLESIFGDAGGFAALILGGILIALGLLFLFKGWQQGIYVTEKNVYGTTVWGKRVDIPLDSVSAVSLTGMFSGVSVASSSGRISFLFVENKNEIFTTISNLIQNRQGNKVQSVTPSVDRQTAADEIKQFKELLDSGIITQEEFDTKKKEILGL